MQIDHQPTTRETMATLFISGMALVLMLTAGYFTPDLLAGIGH